MQDIVLRKVRRTRVATPTILEQPSAPTNQEQRKLTLAIEGVISYASKIGGWLLTRLQGEYTPEIVQEAEISLLHQPRILEAKQSIKRTTTRPKTTKHPKKRIQEAVKNSVHKCQACLSTTHGKLSAVQVLLMAGLFVYVGSLKGNPQLFEPKNIGETTQNSSLRLFLPTASDYVEPKPFEENKAASFQAANVPLHAWLTPWNIEQLKDNMPNYRSVSAFWLTAQADGTSFQARAEWSLWQDFRQNSAVDGQQFFLTVNGNPEYIAPILNSPEQQDLHITNLLQTVINHNFDGIDLDYEGLGRDNQDLFTEFIRNLASQFHKEKKLVSVTVEARIANQVPMDWRSLGQIADEVRIMTYDYHAKETGYPGPIAPIGWLKETLDYAKQSIPGEKLLIGLGNYGYDWQEPTAENEPWQGSGISFDQAIANAEVRQAPIIRANGIDDRGYDVGSTPTYTYKDEDNRQHAVWFEDAASLQTKVNLVNQYKTAGIIFWSVGLGDKSFWQANHIPN